MRVPRFGVFLFSFLLMYVIDAHAQWAYPSAIGWPPNIGPIVISPVDTNVIWMTADDVNTRTNLFARTTDKGVTWIQGSITGTQGLNDGSIAAIDAQTAVATLRDPTRILAGGVFKTTDGGATWSRQTSAYPGVGGAPFFIYFWNADTGVVVGDRNFTSWEIYTTTNGGYSWTPVPQVNIPPMISGEGLVEPFEFTVLRNTFWYCTDQGRVFKSIDRGHTWTVTAVGSGYGRVHSLAFQNDSIGLACVFTTNSQVPTTMRTTDGGITWMPIAPPSRPSPQIITHVPGTLGVYVVNSYTRPGTLTGSAYTLDGGTTWTTVDDRSYGPSVFLTPSVGWTGSIGPDGVGSTLRWSGSALVPSPHARLLMSRKAVDLGYAELGGSSDTSVVTIYSGGMSQLSISSYSLLHQQTSFQIIADPMAPAEIAPGASAVVKMVFTPTRPGVVNDTLVIASNDPLGPISRIALTGNSYSIAQAQTGLLYAMSGSPDSSRLASISTSNGAATMIGRTGYPSITSMAVHPSTREIIGLVTGNLSGELVRINSVGGDAHPLSAINIPLAKGMTFGQGALLYVGTFNARIYRMNYMTGATIDTVLTDPPIRIGGLTSNREGELWACVRPTSGPLDGIYKINFSTGKTTLIGYTGLGGRVLDVLFYKGSLYGLMDSTGLSSNRLIQINTATGAGTVVGLTGSSSLQAIAAVPENATRIREVGNGALPMKITLDQNYPNPFNPATTVSFSLPSQSFVSLKVFDALGREVAKLVSEVMPPGNHSMRWDASKVPSGIYYYRLQAPPTDGQAGVFTVTRKAVLLK